MKKEFDKKSIQFTRQQAIVLAALCLLLSATYIFTIFAKPVLNRKPTTYKLEEIITKRANLKHSDSLKKSKIQKLTSGNKKTKGKIYYTPPPKYVSFNPNHTDSLTWVQMGVKPRTVRTIINYLNKGGKFWDCDDISKIYSLDSVTFSNILPYCHIPKKEYKKRNLSFNKPNNETYQRDTSYKKKYEPKPQPKVDISTADTTQLMSLYGIGPTLSTRIVDYRKSLGGFYSIEQLKEVWGLEQEVISGFENRLTNTASIQKFSLTSDPAKMVEHPYINWSQARIIARYIQQHGTINDLSTFKKIHGLPAEMIKKISPYLAFDSAN